MPVRLHSKCSSYIRPVICVIRASIIVSARVEYSWTALLLGYALSITNLSTMDNGIGSSRFIGRRSRTSRLLLGTVTSIIYLAGHAHNHRKTLSNLAASSGAPAHIYARVPCAYRCMEDEHVRARACTHTRVRDTSFRSRGDLNTGFSHARTHTRGRHV